MKISTFLRVLLVSSALAVLSVWSLPDPGGLMTFFVFLNAFLLTIALGLVMGVLVFFHSDDPTWLQGGVVVVCLVGSSLSAGLAGIVGFTAGLLGSPSRHWWPKVTAALAGLAVAYLLTVPVKAAAFGLAFRPDRAALEALVADVRSRAREAIGRQASDRVASELARTGYLSVDANEDYVMFIKGGFLDNVYGVLCVLPARQPPQRGDPMPSGHDLVSIAHVDGCWYRFTTT